MEQAIEAVESLAAKNEARLDEYVRNGGSDTHYLDGKAQAFYDVLVALRAIK